MSRRLSVAALSALLLVLPFEPRRPVLRVLGLHQFTLLEALAVVATVVLLAANPRRVAGLVRRPPLALAFLASFAAAQLIAAALAPMNVYLAAKFALRMAAAAVFALAVAAVPADVLRQAFPALVVSSAAVALLAVMEGAGLRALDSFLDMFRAGPFWIGLQRRASAGSESPNLAAAVLVYGLLAAAALAAARAASWRRVVPLVLLLSAGLLFTHSRGGLMAAVVGLVVLGLALGWRRPNRAAAPAAALLTLAASFAVQAATGPSPGRWAYAPRGTPAHAVRYALSEAVLTLLPGETRVVSMTLANAGRQPWVSAVLGCSWQRAESAPAMDWPATSRCPITAVPPAAPGEDVRVDAAIRAPEAEGRFLLMWDLVADGWVMSSQGVPPATLLAVVARDPRTIGPIVPPASAAAPDRGRAALWRAALAMWREHPLTGVGPDNFRWAHAAYAGWASGLYADALIPANNLFLETAATTGALGLIALAGTLAATAGALLRLLSTSPPGSDPAVLAGLLLALLAAIAAHGTVDSLLGFTAHYVFLALVVGGAAGLISAPRPS